MSIRYRVAVQGFSAFEKATFESFFRLAARRAPAYDYVSDLQQADFVVTDADQLDALEAVQGVGRLRQSVCIGSRPAEGAAAQMPRPINLMNLLRKLDELARATSGEQIRMPAPAAPPAAAASPRPLPPRPPGVTDFRDSGTFSNSVLVEGDEKFDTSWSSTTATSRCASCRPACAVSASRCTWRAAARRPWNACASASSSSSSST